MNDEIVEIKHISKNADGKELYYRFNNIGSTEAVTDSDGNIMEIFQYGPYGELTSENKCGILFLYNGEYGVSTDENGLYYMRARYYNSEIKRFINQDVVIGSIADSPSMNRYAYVQGNPISLADPFGLSPSVNWKAAGHFILGALGLLTIIPNPIAFAIGAVANIVNAAWYAAEGDYFSAVCCGVAVLGGGFGLLAKTGYTSCGLMQFLRFSTAGASIAIGGYDMYQIGKSNYERALRGEKLTVGSVIQDLARIGLDSASIAGGIMLATEPISYCFVAGTLVATSEGQVAIEQIKVGDTVLAEDPETGEIAYKTVTQTFVNESDELIHVHVNGEDIVTTPSHPFYVNQFGWTRAAQLRAGDVLVLLNGEYVVVEWIQHEILETPIKVYNFEVEDFHTYFVGKSSVLVHNECVTKTTSQHARELRNNMTNEGVIFEDGQAAAHIVASGGSKRHWKMAAESRKILERYGINVDTAANGVPLDSATHGLTHTRVFHENVYNSLNQTEQEMINMLNNVGITEESVRSVFIKDALEAKLRSIGEELLIGAF